MNFGSVQAPMGVKRMGVPMQSGPAIKVPRTDGEGWLCEKCGNHNFEGRAYCNLRKCGAPGPWNCGVCGNKNFATRDVCNMRNCNQPRPPPPAGHAVAGSVGGVPGVNQQATYQAIAMLQASGLGNLAGGLQDGISQMLMGQAGLAGGGQKGQQHFQEGSWVCLGCGNINFPTRTNCNAKMCGRPRTEVDGGPPKPGASTKSIYMPGSWVCGACQNINWPKRESCGLRSCGRPRHEVDAGAPSPEMLQAQHLAQGSLGPVSAVPRAIRTAPMSSFPMNSFPMNGGPLNGGPMNGGPMNPNADPANGAWNCPHCGNLNFAGREACNKRTCGRPRYS